MKIFALEGSWAQYPWGLLGCIDKKTNNVIKRVHYPGQFASQHSYNESVSIGVNALKEELLKTQESYCLVGYSQGAHVVGDIAAEFHDDPNFVKAYLIADPRRHKEDPLAGEDPGGEGVFGGRKIGPKATHFAAEGDFITCCTNPFISNVSRYILEKRTGNWLEWIRSFKDARAFREDGGDVLLALKQVLYFHRAKIHSSYSRVPAFDGVSATDWIASDLLKHLTLDLEADR